VAEQQLNRAQVFRLLVDQRRLGPSHRVRAVLGPVEPDIAHPIPEHPRVLPRADVRRAMNAAREQVVLGLEPSLDDPGLHRCTRWWRDLELHRSSGLVLRDDRARRNLGAMLDVAQLQCHQITAPQLAVDAQVEQRQFTCLVLALQPGSDRPYVAGLERCLLPHQLALVPRHALSASGLT
jgi:hypothetical protein